MSDKYNLVPTVLIFMGIVSLVIAFIFFDKEYITEEINGEEIIPIYNHLIDPKLTDYPPVVEKMPKDTFTADCRLRIYSITRKGDSIEILFKIDSLTKRKYIKIE